MKNRLLIIALSTILLVSGLSSCTKSNDEVNQIDTETISQTKTEQVTTTKNTTAPQITELTETTQTEVEVKPEVVLPKNTYAVDLNELYGEKKLELSSNLGFTYIDDDTICFHYKGYSDKNDNETHWQFKIFDIESKTQNLHITVPDTVKSYNLIDMRNSSLPDDVLCEFYMCYYSFGSYSFFVENTIRINKDYTYEIIHHDEGIKHIHSFGDYNYYYNDCNIYDAESDEIIVAGEYYGVDHKSNRIQNIKFGIDEKRFVYQSDGWAWTCGFGIYDYTTNETRDVVGTHNAFPFGYYNGKIYSEIYNMDWEEDIIYITDINTLETTAFLYKNKLADGYQYSNNYIFADGKYLLFGADNDMDGMKFLAVNSDTGEIVDEFFFENTGCLSISLIDGYKIILKSRDNNYLYVMDLSYLDEIL